MTAPETNLRKHEFQTFEKQLKQNLTKQFNEQTTNNNRNIGENIDQLKQMFNKHNDQLKILETNTRHQISSINQSFNNNLHELRKLN